MGLLSRYKEEKDRFNKVVWEKLESIAVYTNEDEIDWNKSCVYLDHFYLTFKNKNLQSEVRSIHFVFNKEIDKYVTVTSTIEREQ